MINEICKFLNRNNNYKLPGIEDEIVSVTFFQKVIHNHSVIGQKYKLNVDSSELKFDVDVKTGPPFIQLTNLILQLCSGKQI
jgi:hypothetical protein